MQPSAKDRGPGLPGLSDERFAALFGPGSLGEAPLAATLPTGA